MQGACRCVRENHEKTRAKYAYVQLSSSSETGLSEGQRKADVDTLLFQYR